ncbi:hypothetical protein TcasGA2_TC000985 [Tribolium castaneum]|uniref:Uncharacterized protein n=1 Tax=Tribolium castaneum TaxID=7070 RepID=D6W9F6_TRICA|nr:PREDICTED: uncharacterized protein C1orf131 [Tribolium castaneum]EEZ98488.1 hypothetical protein TcasGA2_TC000985 [Tribolium castaneum]|eukprot:XP_008201054.1 PREDICTED: uncharacterized protein C1orf131 [Tribolium castaneum]
MISEDFIPTRGSLKKGTQSIDFKSVSFESYKPKKQEKIEISNEKPQNKKSEDFNIRRAKHEIVKFGMSGFDPEKKEEAKIQLAIKLGAKPKKNKYKNYKLLKEERAKLKQEEKTKAQFQQLGKNAIGKSTAKGKGFDRKRKKAKGGLLDVYGKVNLKNATK